MGKFSKKKKKAFQPEMTKEEYKEETGQRLGQLKGQGISNVTIIDTTRTIVKVRS